MNDRPQTTPVSGAHSWRWVCAAVVVAAGLAGILGDRYLRSQKRAKALASELRLLNAEWANSSTQLGEARRLEAHFKARAHQVERVAKERDSASWTPVIRGIVKSSGTGIELLDIRARGGSGDEQRWTVQIGGVSKGGVPRTVADRFRLALQQELEGAFQGSVKTRFERLDDLPDADSTLPEGRRGIFTIIATIGVTNQAEGKSGEGT